MNNPVHRFVIYAGAADILLYALMRFRLFRRYERATHLSAWASLLPLFGTLRIFGRIRAMRSTELDRTRLADGASLEGLRLALIDDARVWWFVFAPLMIGLLVVWGCGAFGEPESWIQAVMPLYLPAVVSLVGC